MGVDFVTRLMYGVDVRSHGPDGRSFLDRVVAGEFGDYDGDPDKPYGSLEEHFVNKEEFYLGRGGFEVVAAEDHYSGEEVGAVAGIRVLEVANRETPRNLTEGLTEADFVARLRELEAVFTRHKLGKPSLWLVSYAG